MRALFKTTSDCRHTHRTEQSIQFKGMIRSTLKPVLKLPVNYFMQRIHFVSTRSFLGVKSGRRVRLTSYRKL
jgi:hypothetical protein